MRITLTPRTAEHVKIYWKKIQDEEIRKYIPLRSLSLEETLAQFEASRQPGSGSFGISWSRPAEGPGPPRGRSSASRAASKTS